MVSVSADSLFVRCGVAAAAYYLPQDLGVGVILALNVRSKGREITGTKVPGPPASRVNDLVSNFMLDRGFAPSMYSISKSKRHTVVDLH
ncbi:conserved hypothetical protein [Theileria equi strain WA]|uniref:Uncharacterized protein n=1 Tax=Theileria equi strain WA TaxID=1537102 RepID=L1LC74_THEEQ|nr:conserved hypothetical protein [Theileria equi strain WA]EKX72946.1 conserved hypothetical protein [Theileria equi strain WA]|eukprot:XP_004832398.1 conserved hypothetical protein [Theileria equi strain WA]